MAYLKNVMPGGDIVALALFLLFDLAVDSIAFCDDLSVLARCEGSMARRVDWRERGPQFSSPWASSFLASTWEAVPRARHMVRPAR